MLKEIKLIKRNIQQQKLKAGIYSQREKSLDVMISMSIKLLKYFNNVFSRN